MTYDELKSNLARAGFSTYYRDDNDTLICSSAEWPNTPRHANSFWVAKRNNDWYVATWGPRVYWLEDSARVPELCIAVLRENPDRAQWDFADHTKKEFQLHEIEPDDLPDK